MSWFRTQKLPWLLLVAAGVILADRLSKLWIVAHIGYGDAIPVIPNLFRLTHWLNDGAAFSLFADAASPTLVRWSLVSFSLIASLAVLVTLARVADRISLLSMALALVLGGALGNAWDRITTGLVVDFLEFHIFHYHWPDFNVADSAIVVGACLMLLDSLISSESPKDLSKSETQK